MNGDTQRAIEEIEAVSTADRIKRRAAEIPGDYAPSKKPDRLHQAVTKLMQLGMEEDEALGLVSEIYWVAAGDFGA